jgi:hypothetical protein
MHIYNRMKGSYGLVIKQEETQDSGRIQQHVVHDDLVINEDNRLCNDFVTKINFQDVQHPSCDNHDDDENDDNVPHAYRHRCSDEVSATCIVGSETASIILSDNDKGNDTNMRFVCDLGYGLPKEVRPRKEKIHAIAKQLVTFLAWQSQQNQKLLSRYPVAPIYVILGKTVTPNESTIVNLVESDTKEKNGIANPSDTKCESDTNKNCCEEHEEATLIHESLLSRMREVWDQWIATDPLPSFPESRISFCYEPLHEFLQTQGDDTMQSSIDNSEIKYSDTIYLSPDAINTLDVTKPPPRNIIIGLLIDRRTIQYNRSVLRAQEHNIRAVRWPIEDIVSNYSRIPQIIHKNEPLNVDCVLEGMQQWHWNIMTHTTTIVRPPLDGSIRSGSTMAHNSSSIPDTMDCRQSFEMAAIQAIQHHIIRHPQRPLHKA